MFETKICKLIIKIINNSRYIALFVDSESLKKLFSVDCVTIYFSQSIPDFGVSTGIMLSSRHFPLVVQVGLWTLARKR